MRQSILEANVACRHCVTSRSLSKALNCRNQHRAGSVEPVRRRCCPSSKSSTMQISCGHFARRCKADQAGERPPPQPPDFDQKRRINQRFNDDRRRTGVHCRSAWRADGGGHILRANEIGGDLHQILDSHSGVSEDRDDVAPARLGLGLDRLAHRSVRQNADFLPRYREAASLPAPRRHGWPAERCGDGRGRGGYSLSKSTAWDFVRIKPSSAAPPVRR